MTSDVSTLISTLYNTNNWKLKLYCHTWWNICQNDDDVILFINGPRGKGKSWGGFSILRYYLETFIKKPLTKENLRDYIVYKREQLLDRAYNLPDYEPIMVDEGVMSAYTGDFAAKEVKDLIKFFAMCRTKHRLVIFISPNFTDIVGRLRKFADYRIRIVARGLGALFSADQREGVDPFHMDALMDMEKYQNDSTPPEDVLRRLRKHVCFTDTLTFPALPQELAKAYAEYRDENVYGENDTKAFGLNDRAVMVLYNLMENWKDLAKIPSLTQELCVDKLCYDPLTKEHFWQSRGELSMKVANLKKLVKKQNKALEAQPPTAVA